MFYDNLKSICESKGLKITTVVTDCGGALGSISKWKKGACPNSDIVVKLSLHLGVTTDYLLLGEEPTPKATMTDTPNSFEVNGDISHSTIGAIGNKSMGSITISNNSGLSSDVLMKVDETSLQLLEAFTNLNFIDKAKVMSLVAELSQDK